MVTSEYVPTSWNDLLRYMQREWKQGEHVCLIGPTGVGKTTLIARLVTPKNHGGLGLRQYVVVFVTKIYDDTIQNDFKGFERIHDWDERKTYQTHVLLWPKPGRTLRETLAIQQATFRHACDVISLDKGWTPIFDEQLYMCDDLKLETENKTIQHQGRSAKLTCINSTQRPSGVPLVTYSGSTHAFIWKNTIDVDLKRLSNIGSVRPTELHKELETLNKHEFLYINTRTGYKARSQVER